MVGLAELRIWLWNRWPSAPSRAASSSRRSRSIGVPVISDRLRSRATTDGVSRTGHEWAATRDRACASVATGLSTAGLEPCPATPCAVSFIQAVPRSPTATG